ATTSTSPARRRRWPWYAALAAVVAAALAVPRVVRGTGGGAANATHERRAPDPDDPWAKANTPPPPGPARPVVPLGPGDREAIRRELAEHARHVAGDLRSVIGVSLAELRADAALGPAVTAGSHSLIMGTVSSMLVGRCDFDLAGRARWLILGVDSGSDFDLIARGDWTRDDIERCLMQGREGEAKRIAASGASADLGDEPLTQIPLDGADSHRFQTVGWLDDHTFVTSTRAGADADYITERLVGAREAQPSALTAALTGLDRRSTMWLASTREGFDDVVEQPALRGAAMTAHFSLTDQGGEFGVVLAYDDVAAANGAHDYLDRQLAAMADGGLLGAALPGLAIERKGTSVQIGASVPRAFLAPLRDQLVKAMP
ncbi:MAG TPA: hypothetical protein VHE35_18435, partial [Kofleriaceae bacterium]|nr:hypothetical protein [Kofleriaceae bacterium]